MRKMTLSLLLTLVLLMTAAMSTLALGSGVESATTDVVTVTSALPVPELPLVAEPIELTAMFPRQTAHGDFENMWFLEEVAKQTNISVKIQAIESTG